jgi:hypothetical protein
MALTPTSPEQGCPRKTTTLRIGLGSNAKRGTLGTTEPPDRRSCQDGSTVVTQTGLNEQDHPEAAGGENP